MRTSQLLAALGASCAIALAGGGAVASASSPNEFAGLECDPNYSGCVPMDSDVDCEGGGGNGPSFVEGPVDVIGNDIYGLDADNDGVGCDTGSGDGGGSDNGGGDGGGGAAGGGQTDDGEPPLADTGSTSEVLVGAASAALLAGGFALLVSRRRTA